MFNFNNFEHDPPNSDDIKLCAGPEERRALKTALRQRTNIHDVHAFINELHSRLQVQAVDVDTVNEDIGAELFYEDDDDISFDLHLSDMCQEDVDKVKRHLHVLFVESCDIHTDVYALDKYVTDEERTDIYNTVIAPWLTWVSSAKKTNTNTNNKTNNTNMNNNNTPATANMFTSLTSTFANMLGKLEPDTVRMTFNGGIAVKTTKGYKTYDVAKKKAVNMDSLVMPEMSAFLLLPSTKVKVGDIILRDGAFYSIISTDDATNELVGYNYETGKKETLVRETHCFLGSTYFYSKLFSPVLSFFGSKTTKSEDKKEEGSTDEASEDTISTLLPLAMMSQGDMNSMLPMLLMSKMEGKGESSGMLKMLMLSGVMGNNAVMNNMLPLMLLGGDFPTI